jgi:hypothetical protein
VDTRPSIAQQICHLDRSAAEWRDLRFLFGSSHKAKALIDHLRLQRG